MTLDRDSLDLTAFTDNNESNKYKESVENTIKSVPQNINETNNNIQVHSANVIYSLCKIVLTNKQTSFNFIKNPHFK